MIGLDLKFDFGEIKEISAIKINLRSINKNNVANKYKIYAITDNGDFFIKDIDIIKDLKNDQLSLGETIKAKGIKLVALNNTIDLYNIASLEVKQVNKELKKYNNISLENTGEEKDISEDLNSLKLLEEGTIIARFNATDTSSVHSILGISNSNTINGYFSIYAMSARVGVEIRNQTTEGNTGDGTTNLAHIYAYSILNEGINTIAFKVTKGIGYSLYLNGILIKETTDGITSFLSNIQGLDKVFIGKTKRYSGNEYLFKGNIDFVRIYDKPLPNEYLIKQTRETKSPLTEEILPEGVYKSKVEEIFYPQYLGSNNYRIPALYTTKLGTVLAAIDARISSGRDSPNNIDTAIRRKELNKNWEMGKIILDFPDAASAIDTSLLQDRDTGRIFLTVTHFAHGYGFPNVIQGTGYENINGKKYLNLYDSSGNKYTVREGFKVYNSSGNTTNYTLDIDNNLYENGSKINNILTSSSPLKVLGTSFLVLIYSDDDGKTWSKPRDLNPETKENWMKFMGTGPGRGLQIKNGQHKGRLLFPIYYTNSSNFQSSAIIYSDDHGATWKRGESPNDNRLGQIGNSDTVSSGSQLTESQVVEMPNGQLKLFMRNTGNGGYVRVATSFDGAETWYEDVELDKSLREPYCQLSVINYSNKIDGKDAIIFSNPDATSRSNGSIKIGLISENGTYSNGQTKYSIEWKYNKVIKPDFFAYSCLTELLDGNIGVFYEGTGNQQMSYMSMNIEYIKYIPEILVTTPKIEKIEILENKLYKAGESISLKINFSEVVSIIGNKEIEVVINNETIKFTIDRIKSGKEYIFKGNIPFNLTNDQYILTIKSNNNVNFIGIFNKIINITEDIKVENKLYIEDMEVNEELNIEGAFVNSLQLPLKTYENISIVNTGEEKDISLDLNEIKSLTEGIIIAKFNATDTSSVHSILGISNSKTNNGYFAMYVSSSRVGVEIRNQTAEGNTNDGTTNLAHIYVDVAVNKGINTIAFKVNKGLGYSLYLNGVLVKEIKDSDTKFLADIKGLDTMFIGKTKRFSGNEYVFKGNIDFIKVYKETMDNENLLKAYENINIVNIGEEKEVSLDLNEIKYLTEGSISAKFNATDVSQVHSILGISNSKTNNGYFALYVTSSRVGVEIRNQIIEGNTSEGTTNLAHIYADVTLNNGVNTVDFKVTKGIGYELYLNNALVKEIKDSNTKFLADIKGLDTMFIGKTKRFSGNEYVFKGNIEFLGIYKENSKNDYLLMETGVTKKPNEEDILPDYIYKSKVIDVFKPGDLNSSNYRIPALITTKKGNIIAGIDARIGGGHDSPNNIDSAIKISKDGGLTWDSGKIVINYPDQASIIDISLLQDETTERIFLLVDAFPHGYGAFQAKRASGFKTINNTRCMILLNSSNVEFYLRPDGKVIDGSGIITAYTVDGDNNLYKNAVKIGNIFGATSELKAFGTSYLALIYSDDEGETWSKPNFISGQFKKEWMSFLGTGPGRGIQIKNGVKAGRLIFPVYYLNSNVRQNSAVIYSDDHGVTWKLGESPNDGRVEGTTTISSETLSSTAYELTEAQVVEMPNGQLKMFMRNRAAYARIATSFDYGETWDKTVELDTALREPYCQLSVINYSNKVDGKDAIIFANPDATSRSNGSIKVGLISESGTYSNGQPKYSIEWKYNKVIKEGYFAYSCLTELPNGNIGLFYEGTPNLNMSYIAVDLEYMKYNFETMTEIKSIALLNNKTSYEAGETIGVKILFDQAVSIIGNRTLDIMLDNILIKLDTMEVKGNECLFTGKIPLSIAKAQFSVTIKANKDMKIINIYNLVTTIEKDILLPERINVINTTPLSTEINNPNYSYNAVNGVLENGALIEDAGGTKVAGWIGGPRDGATTVTVNVASSGSYKLAIQYIGADANRNLKIDINGINTGSIYTPLMTSGWTIADAKTFIIEIKLNSGINTIKFHGDGTNYGPSLGTITLILTSTTQSSNEFIKNKNVEIFNIYEDLESSNNTSQNYIIEYNNSIFSLEEGEQLVNNIKITTKKVNDESVKVNISN
ncbi:sialidase domain-containing protein [Clostridium tarantellae]|uniref:exo-alpha-sialidase n=1 Tax=Clostridium tarantellae TaxID=39493 RepID=A0A6I1MIX4_9CLOT|nr:sialidase domain-containing protein [Clostridium tarantellae]MPQ43486.1 hypothetical protein [Clostridium tarantellae]